MGDSQERLPSHSFEDKETRKEHGYNIGAAIFHDRVSSLWHKRQGNVTPQEVIDLFNDPKKQKDLWPDISLYNVWLAATWQADNWTFGGPQDIPNDPEILAHHAKLDQIAALIKDAAKQAGHWPEECAPYDKPK